MEALIGKNKEDCHEQFKELRDAGYIVNVIPEGSVVTRDYRLDRIRVSYDNNGIITRASIG